MECGSKIDGRSVVLLALRPAIIANLEPNVIVVCYLDGAVYTLGPETTTKRLYVLGVCKQRRRFKAWWQWRLYNE